MDKISVIIRNRNESEYIGFAIQSCLDNFKKPEIIVVDNNSTDDSLHVVNLFKDRTNIKVITINDYTPGKSINLGVEHATNERILVLSAHAQITTLDNHSAESQITTTVYYEGSVNNMSGRGTNQNTNQTNNTAGSYGNSNMVNSRQITEKDVGINLTVTPRINDESRITLVVDASVEAPINPCLDTFC